MFLLASLMGMMILGGFSISLEGETDMDDLAQEPQDEEVDRTNADQLMQMPPSSNVSDVIWGHIWTI